MADSASASSPAVDGAAAAAAATLDGAAAEEGGAAYVAGGTSDVAALMGMDSEDESLRKYKESLLGAAASGDLGDTSDGRRVVVTEFRIEFEEDGVDDFVAELDTPEKTAALAAQLVSIKQGAQYKLRISFKVNGEIVDSLKFKTVTKRGLISQSDEIMIGSYAPSSTPNVFVSPRDGWQYAPEGMVFRGKYNCYCDFVDLHGESHLAFKWSIKIGKTW